MKNNENDSEEVKLAIVLGYIAVKELSTNEKKVAVLSKLGYSNQDMSTICGTESNAIRAIKSKLQKGVKK